MEYTVSNIVFCLIFFPGEEEMAAAAAAREAAIAAGLLDPSQLEDVFEPDADQSQDSQSGSSSPTRE